MIYRWWLKTSDAKLTDTYIVIEIVIIALFKMKADTYIFLMKYKYHFK